MSEPSPDLAALVELLTDAATAPSARSATGMLATLKDRRACLAMGEAGTILAWIDNRWNYHVGLARAGRLVAVGRCSSRAALGRTLRAWWPALTEASLNDASLLAVMDR